MGKANAPLSDWRNDWLYTLLLGKAEEHWDFCLRSPDKKLCQYVLIAECASASERQCGNDVVRAWIRDVAGLREITVKEFRKHKSRIRGRIYPFVLMDFHIEPNRVRVVLGVRMASTAGFGGRFLVQGNGDRAELVDDPMGGPWVS